MKIILPALLLLTSFSFADDFSQGNSNPFQRYEYRSEFDWQKKNSNVINNNNNYFSTSIQNPLNAKQSKKYQNLINNSQSLNGCWDRAGKIYNVDPWLLLSIAKVESNFNHQAININKNKSADTGMMQINDIWLPTLNKFGIKRNDLFEPCTSVFVGAWIVAQNIKSFGYNQDGIGAYNSPSNITYRRNYAKKVYAAYNELVRDFSQVVRR